MKTPLPLLASVALCSTPLYAKSFPSPDGRFKVDVGETVQVKGFLDDPLITLDTDTRTMQKASVTWSPDSTRVVVVESYGRGSAVFASWNDHGVWHKTLEPDSDFAAFYGPFHLLGTPVKESRSPKGWATPEELVVDGELQFRGGQSLRYQYTLGFVAPSGKLDRGGYEEGVIKGHDFQPR
jgi:hypothetical protein